MRWTVTNCSPGVRLLDWRDGSVKCKAWVSDVLIIVLTSDNVKWGLTFRDRRDNVRSTVAGERPAIPLADVGDVDLG
jgi:hypothetical protein